MKRFNGIIGAFLAGLISSIPWLLIYVYGNYIIAFLALPIALAADWGYKKMGGDETKNLGTIIAVITLLIVALQIFIIIPLLLLQNSGNVASISNLISLYETSPDFTSAILKDAFISILFAVIGISSVIKSINSFGSNEPIWKTMKQNNAKAEEESIKQINEIFAENNAYYEENAIAKEEFKELYKKNPLAINTYNKLVKKKIIIKFNKKFYMDKEKLKEE